MRSYNYPFFSFIFYPMVETCFHTVLMQNLFFCKLLFRERKKKIWLCESPLFFSQNHCLEKIQCNRKREKCTTLFVAFIQLLALSLVKISFSHCCKKNYELVFSYLRNPAVQSMRLCGKERGVATWLSMQAPLTPPVCIWWQCVGRLLLLSSALISFQLEGWGRARWGSSSCFSPSFCLKNNFSPGSNGCRIHIKPCQAFILTNIIRLGDIMG